MLVAVDGDSSVGALVRVNPDGDGHGRCLSLGDETEVGTPDSG